MRLVGLSLILYSALTAAASAISLQVTPISVEVPAPGVTASISLRNRDVRPLTVQVRIFRWSQDANGLEQLEPTVDVVASPPAVDLKLDQEYVFRIVRVAKAPVVGEETYRFIVDELSEPVARPGTVNFKFRYSIPVFFGADGLAPAKVTYRVRQGKQGLKILATNQGGKRSRLSAVTVSDSATKNVSFGAGLVGYVLSRSNTFFIASKSQQAFRPGTKVTIKGNNDLGPFTADATVEAGD